jgi:Protein of unknown function (DUF2726)
MLKSTDFPSSKKSEMLRLVNSYEEIAHGEIKTAADRWRLSVYPKVRVADVIPLDRLGVQSKIRSYALRAHFDFVICRDQWEPEYAVEFDGHYHTTASQTARMPRRIAFARWPTFQSCALIATI